MANMQLVSTPFGIGSLPEDHDDLRRRLGGDGDEGDQHQGFTRVIFPWGQAYLQQQEVAKAPEFTFYALSQNKRLKFTLVFPLTALGRDMIEAVRQKLDLDDSVAISLVQTDSVSKHEIKPDQKIGDCTIATNARHPPILVLKAPVVRFDEKKCSFYAMLLEKNSTVVQIAPGFGSVLGNTDVTVGIKYWEVLLQSTRGGDGVFIGVGSSDTPLNGSVLTRGIFWGLSCATGHKIHDTIDSYTDPLRDGDVIGVLLDMEHGRLTFYKNGRNLGVAFSGIQTKRLSPVFSFTFVGHRLKLLTTASAPVG